MNEDKEKIKKQKKDTRYQYSHVELEEVISHPEEYIIPQCLPACKSLWDKNIETYMVSNNDDKDLYVLLDELSPENMAIFKQMKEHDSRYIFDEYRKTIGIAVKGNNENSMHELQWLTEVFKIQDTLRFQTNEEFLESYKSTGGEMAVSESGIIYRKINPALANITFQEALEKSGKSSLYVPEEGRVYDSPMYLNWHQKYEQYLKDSIKQTISDITPYKDNVDGNIAHLRDTYLTAEREYVSELLKSEVVRNLIEEINAENPDNLFAIAQNIVDKVEMGLISEKEMEKIEQQLTVLLAAIQDKVLMRKLVLLPDRESRGKSR